ncbi:DUF4268 domain-containing protein [Halovulum sp. GXIMD14793]
MPKLGRLEKVGRVRDIWPDEARDFTPWLAKQNNLSLLADTLGFGEEGFELEAIEVNNGPFRADILCRDTTSPEGEHVLIENQFGKSDHDHLGKLITYASGLNAKTLILIGEEIREEHRAALDWLNAISSEDMRFFAVSMEVWRIGESLPAPRFNVIVKPNDWSKQVSRSAKTLEADLSPHRQMLIEYWTAFEERLAHWKTSVRPVSPQPQSWLVHSIGKTGVSLNTSINSRENWARAEVYLTGISASGYFNLLMIEKDRIEEEFGHELQWYDAAAKDRRIFIQKDFTDVSEKATWKDQHEWLIENMDGLYRVFHNRIRGLDPETAELF